MSLQIRKKSTSAWEHIKGGQNIILSAGSFRLQNAEFELTELSGVDQFDQPRTPIAEITIYDDTGAGLPEVYTNTTDFVNRLKQLNYPFFSTASGGSGAVDSVNGQIGDVILALADLNDVPSYPNDGQDYVLVENNGSLTWQLNNSGGTDLTKEVNQVAHGLSVGNPIRLNGSNYILALSDLEENAEVIGILVSATTDNFTYQIGGFTSINLGLSNGDSAFLQDDGSIGTSPGTVNLYLGTQTPQGFLIEIGQGFKDINVSEVSRVGFTARNSNTTIPAATFQRVSFITEVEDTNSAWDGSVFTVPTGEGGIYEIFGHATFAQINDGNIGIVGVEVNGSLDSGGLLGRGVNGGTALAGYGGAIRLKLNEGDQIELVAYSGNATSLFNSSQSGYTTFSAYKK